MKPTLFTLTATAMVMAMVSTYGADEQGMLHFLNDDSLPGKFRSLDPEHITWDSRALTVPASFFTDKVRDLRLPGVIHIPDSAVGHEATLTLMNGDTVRGQLGLVTETEIALDTWYAGRLVFRRVMVRDLAIREMPEYLYRGPLAIDEWTQTPEPGTWDMTNPGELAAAGSGGIAKKMPFPEEFTIEFEVQWKGAFLLNLIVLSDDVETDSPENGYELIFQSHSVHLRRCGQRQWIGHSPRTRALRQDEKAHIRLRVSAPTGQFAFYINDKIIDVWTDPEFNAEKLGNGLHFISRDNSPIAISRIDLSKWNGIVEQRADQRPVGVGMRQMGWGFDDEPEESAEEESGNGTMVLRNGDRVRGTVMAIKDGMITLVTPYREVKLPVERLRTLSLPPVDLEEPKRENGDVRAWFTDGGSIVFRLEGVSEDGTKLSGYSQTFGNAVFDLSAFNRLEFNIYDLFREEP